MNGTPRPGPRRAGGGIHLTLNSRGRSPPACRAHGEHQPGPASTGGRDDAFWTAFVLYSYRCLSATMPTTRTPLRSCTPRPDVYSVLYSYRFLPLSQCNHARTTRTPVHRTCTVLLPGCLSATMPTTRTPVHRTCTVLLPLCMPTQTLVLRARGGFQCLRRDGGGDGGSGMHHAQWTRAPSRPRTCRSP